MTYVYCGLKLETHLNKQTNKKTAFNGNIEEIKHTSNESLTCLSRLCVIDSWSDRTDSSKLTAALSRQVWLRHHRVITASSSNTSLLLCKKER